MISYEQALNVIHEVGHSERGREELIPTRSAHKTVLSRDVYGTEDVPFFDNSAMDGFAVCSESTWGASSAVPAILQVKGCIAAGETAEFTAEKPRSPYAIEIMTGAPMPGAPFDAVVRVEDVERKGDEIILRKSVKAGANVRRKGSDFRQGRLVARKGEPLSAGHIMALASLGIAKVHVHARPRVVIISTGKELCDPGEARVSGAQIWNSSGPYLEARFREIGCEVMNLGIVSDCPNTFRDLVRKGLDWGADLVLSTGAVSMGKHDFVAESFLAMGATLHFHKVAIRPGKPICFGEFGKEKKRPVFFGLPGNPVSTAVGARFFVEPYLRSLLRLPAEKGLRAKLLNSSEKPQGLRCFFKAKARAVDGGIAAEILAAQGSYVLSSLLEANCWAVLEEAGESVDAGHSIRLFSLENSWERGIWNE